MLKKILFFSFVILAIWGFYQPVQADEEGVDYGYWCTECNVQHGPGETCPRSSGSYAPDYQMPESSGTGDMVQNVLTACLAVLLVIGLLSIL